MTLTRPRSGRIVTGVALGMSELYGIPVLMIRIVWIAAMLASPLAILLYLLLSISIPNEVSVASELTVEGFDDEISPRERFTRISQILVRRLISQQSDFGLPTQIISIGLLLLAALMELSKVEGARFYYVHPFITIVASDVTRIGTAFFYIAVAAIFLVKRPRKNISVSLGIPVSEKFTLANSIEKMIGGLAAGISQVVKIDTAYIRVLLLVLNILTFGVAGIIYLLILHIFRRREKADSNTEARLPRNNNLQKGNEATLLNERNGYLFHFTMALVFLALAAVRVSSEFRLFFFNEPFIQGILFVLAGIAIAMYGASSSGSRNGRSVSILAGSSIFFAGIYSLAVTIGRVGITSGENIEISEIIAATSIAYFGVVALSGAGRRLALLLSVVVGFCAASIGLHLAPVSDLAAVGQFYDFFYPVVFGVLGLWIAFEK